MAGNKRTPGNGKPLSEAMLRRQLARNKVTGEYAEMPKGAPGASAQLSQPTPYRDPADGRYRMPQQHAEPMDLQLSFDFDASPGTIPGFNPDTVIPPQLAAELAELDAQAKRYAAITEGDYVPAVTMASTTKPQSREGIEDWYRTQALAAEHSPDGDGVAYFPDYNTPSFESGHTIGGRSSQGTLRGYRRAKSRGGLTWRTHSTASIRRHFNNPANDQVARMTIESTFADGKPRVDNVTVYHLPNGAYRVVPDMDPPDDYAMRLSEAHCAEIEGRRVAPPVEWTGNLIEDYRRRAAYYAANEQNRLVEVDSSWLKGVRLVNDGDRPAVAFQMKNPTKAGVDTYYRAGGLKDIRDVFHADNVGSTASKKLRQLPAFHGIVDCPRCGNPTANLAKHACQDKIAKPEPSAGTKAMNTHINDKARREAILEEVRVKQRAARLRDIAEFVEPRRGDRQLAGAGAGSVARRSGA